MSSLTAIDLGSNPTLQNVNLNQSLSRKCYIIICTRSFIVMLVIEPYNFSFSEIFLFFLLFMYEIACLAR